MKKKELRFLKRYDHKIELIRKNWTLTLLRISLTKEDLV